jgi:hypothetical protein
MSLLTPDYPRRLWRWLGASTLAWTLLGGCSEDEVSKSSEEHEDASAGDDGAAATQPCGPCEAPSFCHAGECEKSGTSVVSGGVGSDPDEFAVLDVEEAQSQAPQALAVHSESGRVYILDHLNERVSVFVDGEIDHTIPIEGHVSEELAVLDSGLVVVMNRYADELQVYDDEGGLLETNPINGAGIESPDYAGALYSRDDGVWMKTDGSFIHVLDTEGKAVERRRILPGLPSPDLETLVSVRILGDGSLAIVSRPTSGEAEYKQAHQRYARPVATVSAFDIDDAGNVYLGTSHLWREDDDVRLEVRLTVLSPELEEIRQEVLPLGDSSRAVTRFIAVGRDGGAHYLKVDEDRISVLRF